MKYHIICKPHIFYNIKQASSCDELFSCIFIDSRRKVVHPEMNDELLSSLYCSQGLQNIASNVSSYLNHSNSLFYFGKKLRFRFASYCLALSDDFSLQVSFDLADLELLVKPKVNKLDISRTTREP